MVSFGLRMLIRKVFPYGAAYRMAVLDVCVRVRAFDDCLWPLLCKNNHTDMILASQVLFIDCHEAICRRTEPNHGALLLETLEDFISEANRDLRAVMNPELCRDFQLILLSSFVCATIATSQSEIIEDYVQRR